MDGKKYEHSIIVVENGIFFVPIWSGLGKFGKSILLIKIFIEFNFATACNSSIQWGVKSFVENSLYKHTMLPFLIDVHFAWYIDIKFHHNLMLLYIELLCLHQNWHSQLQSNQFHRIISPSSNACSTNIRDSPSLTQCAHCLKNSQ